MAADDISKEQEKAMEAAQERTALPHLRDILKREHDEMRQRNEALEKWGPALDAELLRDLEREHRKTPLEQPVKLPTPPKQPQKRGPDMDMG